MNHAEHELTPANEESGSESMATYKIEVMWGLIFIAVLLLWMVLERAVGLHSSHIDKHLIYTNLFAIPAIAVYVFALRDKKARYYDGQMSYRQGLKSGTLVTLVVVIFSPLTQWLISTLITPEYFRNAIDYSVASGFFESRAAAEAYFNLQNYMKQSAIGALVMGIVTSLIVAYFVRSRSPNDRDAA